MTLTDPKNQTTQWQYDHLGRVTNKLDQASAQILRYLYDAEGQLTNRWSAAKGTTGYLYDAAGNLTKVDYPAGTTDITMAYDARNQLTNMVDAAGTTKYTYTALGELLTEDGPFTSDTVTYAYHASVPGLRTGLTLQQPSGSWSQTYGYDAAKRLSTVGGTAGTHTYTCRGAGTVWTNLALPNTSRITNAYDTVGRLTQTRLRNSGSTALNTHSYVYNLGHQRTRQTRSDASTFDYTYDHIGQLRTAVGTGGQSTENLDGQERTSANTPTVSYARGQDLSGTLEGAGGIGGLLARSDQYSGGTWGRHVFYHADGNGNVTALIDSAQTVVAAYRYNPYGQLLGSSGSLAGVNTLRFSSKPWFQSEGLYYYGYRFYDPNLQRWINRDPIGELGGINLYAFVGNHPTGRLDPDGRFAWIPLIKSCLVALGAEQLAEWIGESLYAGSSIRDSYDAFDQARRMLDQQYGGRESWPHWAEELMYDWGRKRVPTESGQLRDIMEAPGTIRDGPPVSIRPRPRP